jgi:hypothetical protein
MRALVILAVIAALAAAASPAAARPACAAPAAAVDLKLPAFTPTRETPACARRIEAARAQVQKDADAFNEAQKRIDLDMKKILELQNGVACEPSARAYVALRRRQTAAVLKALAEELSEGLGPCGLVAAPSEPEPAPETEPGQPLKQDLPPMLEPI